MIIMYRLLHTARVTFAYQSLNQSVNQLDAHDNISSRQKVISGQAKFNSGHRDEQKQLELGSE